MATKDFMAAWNRQIFSYGGHDVIYGGVGDDQLHAGEGVDIFVFNGSGGDGSDRIGDLAVDLDDEHGIFEVQDKLCCQYEHEFARRAQHALTVSMAMKSYPSPIQTLHQSITLSCLV